MSDPIRARLAYLESLTDWDDPTIHALRAVLDLCEQKDDVDEPLWSEVVRDVIAEHLGVTE